MTMAQILTEAAKLDPKELEALAEALWERLAFAELSPEQMSEIRRRVDAFDRGEVETIAGDQVMREVQEELRRFRETGR